MNGLTARLQELASTPVLLAASDFDGVLAPIADTPDAVALDPAAWAALQRVHALPHTHGAIVSGRARADLLAHLPEGFPADFAVIGSHGAERGSAPVVLSAVQREHLHQARLLFSSYAASLPGAIVEQKPASVCFHYRRCDPDRAAHTVEMVRHHIASIPGLTSLDGDMILEVFVHPPGKDTAVESLRHAQGATAVVFLGDDTTDEMVFAHIGAADLGVKVGPTPTIARFRIDAQADVAAVFNELAVLREQFLARRVLTPIPTHALLSDQRTIAIVDPAATIVWACLPRIDSSPIFSRLLGDRRGEFAIHPSAGPDVLPPTQNYDPDTFTLRTSWPGLTVTDYFDCSAGRAFQRAGRSELIRVVESSIETRLVFAPRLDFGRTPTHLIVRDDGLEVDGWHDPVVLRSPGVQWEITREQGHDTAVAIIPPGTAGPLVLELRYGTASLLASGVSEGMRREQTRRFWSGWAASLELPSEHREIVRRSALVIKALTHGPTGAIAAAATTSLPEHLGGVRNWDYRYCWPRDACMSAAALIRIGNTGTAIKLLDWLVGVVERTESPERLRPIYTVSGGNLQPEAEIADMPGYGQSRPVRIGNAASHQVQLDVFGPIVDLVAMLAERGAPVTPEQWNLVQAMVRAVEMRWQEPDHGIWEIRGPKRHHVHTKVMCCLAVERGRVVAETAMGVKRPQWGDLAQRIRAEVLAQGWNDRVGAFTGAYGSDHLDSAVLLIGLTGLIAPTDDRFIRTVAAIQRSLKRGPVVYRYLEDDGLPGREGAWIICATWLVESLALIGRSDEAQELLNEVLRLAGPTGLMAEEFDPEHGIALGNFPQAYSHLGVINAVIRLQTLRR